MPTSVNMGKHWRTENNEKVMEIFKEACKNSIRRILDEVKNLLHIDKQKVIARRFGNSIIYMKKLIFANLVETPQPLTAAKFIRQVMDGLRNLKEKRHPQYYHYFSH